MEAGEVRALRTALKLIQRRLRREVLATKALSRTALQVLSALARAGRATPSALAVEVHLTSSNVAAALRELEAAGHVHREPDPDDRRRSWITPSESGRRVVSEIRDERDTWLGRVITAELDDEEQQLLIRAGELLTRLASHPDGEDSR